ncbi:MAG: M90 family metallopeptidase [Pseudomonadota bacterium]
MIFYLVIVLGIAAMFGRRWWMRRQARTELLGSRLDPHDRAIMLAQVPLLRKLPPELHAPLEGKMNLFLDQVELVGCNGLEVTQDMALSIAAQACLLVVNTDAWYRNLTTVLIYPGAFKSKKTTRDGFVVTEADIVRTGESWTRGPVILSWAHSQEGAQDQTDGHNVVLHEFAHQMDDMSGHTDGAPVMAKGQSLGTWERVFVDAHTRHVQAIEQGRATVLDAYGATNHQEYFAVAVEVFFEKPRPLRAQEPEVYAQLSTLLRLDPAEWK